MALVSTEFRQMFEMTVVALKFENSVKPKNPFNFECESMLTGKKINSNSKKDSI